ncbi:ADP-ribosylglycohydrolase family protein, partial [Nonomuraea turkmeniaca]
MSHRDGARGCLLGLAAGDALGAPAENLSPAEIRRRWGRLTEIEG